ncbi:MAG: MIP family channel protein [Clostridia bacterium]|nr:MIP family channel protein [Clostridia bacterium]
MAELIGTAVLVFFGCGTACVIGCDVTGGYLATAVAFGLVIVAMAYSIGNISGCHINPAVTLSMFISNKISLKDAVTYWIAQFAGGILGGALLLVFFPKSSGLGTNGLYDGSIAKSLLIEVILTFVFVLAILGVTSKVKNDQIAGLVIGLTLTLVHILGIGFTGTSVNPARSFGPALFAGGDALKNVWVFIVAPLIGAAIAAYCWKYLSKNKK